MMITCYRTLLIYWWDGILTLVKMMNSSSSFQVQQIIIVELSIKSLMDDNYHGDSAVNLFFFFNKWNLMLKELMEGPLTPWFCVIVNDVTCTQVHQLTGIILHSL